MRAHQVISSFSRRLHKNMSLCYGDTADALNNRKNFLENLGIDYRQLVCAKQIHSSSIRYVTTEDLGKGALSYDSAINDTDALITDKKNLPLAIFTADCLSIFLYAAKTPAVGLVHAGWRSTQENIMIKTIQLMEEKFNTKPQDLHLEFGPAIRGCCYEVNPVRDYRETVKRYDVSNGVNEEFSLSFSDDLIKRDGHYYLDLAKANKKQVLDLGVKEINIFDSHICTACQNKEFFSYRKEGNASGRMMSVMMLRCIS